MLYGWFKKKYVYKKIFTDNINKVPQTHHVYIFFLVSRSLSSINEGILEHLLYLNIKVLLRGR